MMNEPELISATDELFLALQNFRAERTAINLSRLVAAARKIEQLGAKPAIIKGRSIQVMNCAFTWLPAKTLAEAMLEGTCVSKSATAN